MPRDGEPLLELAAWTPALEKYGAVAALTVELYDSASCLVCGPVFPTPLFELVASKGSPSEFAECASRCLAQTGYEIVLHADDGITILGVPLRLDNKIVGAAVAGYALGRFPDRLAIQRFSRKHRLAVDHVWELVRAVPPMSQNQLTVRGELLRVLGEALLKEQLNSRNSAKLYEESRVANRAKDEFLSVLSHELRTPLNAIVTWTAVGRIKKYDSAAVGQVLDNIERSSEAQVRVIDDLLDISRIVTGRLRVDMAPVDLTPLVRESLETVHPAATAKAIALEQELEGSVTVLGDRARLRQILWNLLSNAVKFTPANGRVGVKVQQTGNSSIAITISDSGVGIAKDFLPHVFERFTQYDASTSRRHLGLGLGLAITRYLVEMHGGTIRAESAGPGKGAEFIIELPLNTNVDAGSTLRPESRPTEATEPASAAYRYNPDADDWLLNGVRILAIDDHIDTRESLSTLLEQFGASVSTAGSAAEALAALPRVKPEILIVDIGLPDEDGYSLLKKVRALPIAEGGHIPAVALTGFTREQDRRMAASVGFQRHLAKPINVEELLSTLKHLVEQQRGFD
jgi:signal transduction histidine kinase/CheY-like chemotaxis protein